jgi:hypothetical protein
MSAGDPFNPQRPPRTPLAVLEAAIKRIDQDIVDAKLMIESQEQALQVDRDKLARFESERAEIARFISTHIPTAAPTSTRKRYSEADIAELRTWKLPLSYANPLGQKLGALARMSDDLIFRAEFAHCFDQDVEAVAVLAVLNVANGETPNG